MGYLCELGAGQAVYLENLHDKTLVTIMSSSPGQQQQSSSSFQTGTWTAPPDVFRSPIGFVLKLYTAQGEQFVHLQGSSLRALNEAPSLLEAQPLQVQQAAHPPTSMASMQPMPAMQPMSSTQPMTLGTMQMDREAMSMQMGNMRMSMNPIEQAKVSPSESSVSEAAATDGQRNFCSQCGVSIKPSDRFCAHCGHRFD